jgi:hypothetical protein
MNCSNCFLNVIYPKHICLFHLLLSLPKSMNSHISKQFLQCIYNFILFAHHGTWTHTFVCACFHTILLRGIW